MTDRLAEVKELRTKFSHVAAPDLDWLISEVERLRAHIDAETLAVKEICERHKAECG